MRDPNRLDSLYSMLLDIHKNKYSDLRFGQFMSLFFDWCIKNTDCSDIFYVEDNKWKTYINEFSNNMKGK